MDSLSSGFSFSRVNVVGTSGSGKSTFARQIAEALEAPHVEMDAIFWGPNWHWPSDEEFFSSLAAAIQGERWVLDGNYTRTIPLKWARVELVVWLDLPFWLTFRQAVARAFRRSWTKEELWPGTGNRESFRKSFFSKESILLWTWNTHSKVRERYESYLSDPQFSHIRFVRLRSHSEAERFLREVKMRRRA